MSLDIISYVRKINNAHNSQSQKESNIFELQRSITRDFKKPIDYEDNSLINGIKQGLLVLRTTKLHIKKIFASPKETFNLGDVIDCYKTKWIVTEVDSNDQIYRNGKMERCNHNLKFMGTNGQIESRPCIVVDGTKYSSGEKESAINIILGDTRRNIVIPRDYETLRIKHGTRFLISNNTELPQAFKLTMIDDVTGFDMNDGYINLICTEDQFNPQTDNAELMIADYYSNTVTYKLELLNHDQSTLLLLNAGDTFQLEVQASRNGEICDKCDNLSYASTNEEIATVDSDGLIMAVDVGNCELIIDFFTEKIILHLDVQAGTAVDAYAISIIDSDNDTEIVFGDENEVVVRVYKNGVEDSSISFEYELLNAIGLAQIKKVEGNQITLFALDNSKNINKTFNLRVWNDEFEIEDIKTFTIVGWFL